VFLRVTQVIGNIGTGKTCTAIKFGEELQKKALDRKINLQHAYLNCKIEGTSRFVLYGNLLRKIAPELSTRSLSPEEMLRQLIDYLQNEEKYVLITVDEVDYFFKRSKEHLAYDLTRLPELTPGKTTPVIGELLISRDLQFHKNLDPSEISTLGRNIIEFPQYNAKQIKDIIIHRVDKAFKSGVLDDGVIDYICDVTAQSPINGDIRLALDLLLYSGILAENQGFNRILPDHARKVYGQTHPTITTQDIISLGGTEKLVLLGLVRSLKSENTPYISLSKIREAYEVICEEYKVKPVKEIEEPVQDLFDRGIVDMKSLTEFGVSGVSAKDLENFLSGITQRLRHDLSDV
jgi:cell division control protein 6